MSRTYRRKNEKWEYYWVTRDWKRDHTCKYGWFCVEYGLDGKERDQAINKFHSDAQRTMNQVPSWFVNQFCNRPFRAKMKQEVRKIMQSGEYDDYNFDPCKQTALWEWW